VRRFNGYIGIFDKMGAIRFLPTHVDHVLVCGIEMGRKKSATPLFIRSTVTFQNGGWKSKHALAFVEFSELATTIAILGDLGFNPLWPL
jgi:hypothetical protein